MIDFLGLIIIFLSSDFLIEGKTVTIANVLERLDKNLLEVIISISEKSDWITKPPKWSINDPLIHVKATSTSRIWKALVNNGKLKMRGGGKLCESEVCFKINEMCKLIYRNPPPPNKTPAKRNVEEISVSVSSGPISEEEMRRRTFHKIATRAIPIKVKKTVIPPPVKVVEKPAKVQKIKRVFSDVSVQLTEIVKSHKATNLEIPRKNGKVIGGYRPKVFSDKTDTLRHGGVGPIYTTRDQSFQSIRWSKSMIVRFTVVEEDVEEVAAISTVPDGDVVEGNSAEMEVGEPEAGAEPLTSTPFPNLRSSSGAISPIPFSLECEDELMADISNNNDVTHCDDITCTSMNASFKKSDVSQGDPFQCDQCDYKTSKTSNLKRHRDLHSMAMFTCNECKFETKRRDNLKRHIESKHKFIKINPATKKQPVMLACDSCEYKTIKKNHLTRHTSAKHSKILYSCRQCNFASNRKDSLKRHEQLIHKFN